MPIYKCKVVDKGGKTTDFIQEALSEDIILRELSSQGLFPLQIRETEKDEKKTNKKKLLSRKTVIELTDTLSLLLASGFTLKDSLEIAQTIFIKGPVNNVIVMLLEKIKKGKTFHDSLNDFGNSFPPLYKGLVNVGEKTGLLGPSFKRLSQYLKTENELRDKLVNSMMYPVLVLGVACIGIVTMIVFVFPRISSMFAQLGTVMPKRMQLMIDLMNRSLIIGSFVIAAVIIAVFILMMIHKKQGNAAMKIDRFLFKIPVIGKIRFLKEGLNFLFAMETLTGGGFSVEDSLETSSGAVKNLALRAGILEARERIMRGESLSEAFSNNTIFPDKLVKWFSIGEKSGHIDRAFSQLRGYYQNQLEKWFSHFVNLIEPILILIVGVFIFLIIILFILPIFSIYERI